MSDQITFNDPAPDTEQTIAGLISLLASIAARIARERAAGVQSSEPPAMAQAA